MMLSGPFLENSIRQPRCNPHIKSQSHACPFCRCKSLDNSINIKIQSKPAGNFSIFLGKDFLDKKNKYSKNDQRFQNVYYRSFDSPKRRGLSPNGSRKIVIQYSSPQPPSIQTSRIFQPIFAPFQASPSKIPLIISSPMKSSPRNIYTNENTPPKAKYLQKKSSRKNSQDKIPYTTPIQGLTLTQSKSVAKPKIPQETQYISPYNVQQPENKINQNKQKQKQLSPIGKRNYLQQIPVTSTKHIIQRLSSPDSSSSPFNSLVQSTPQVVPYGSFSSSPFMANDSSSKKKIQVSIKESNKEITEFKQPESEPKIVDTKTENLEFQKIQQVPKPFEFTPKSQRYSHQIFDKTLGKAKPLQRPQEKQLTYSESDKLTLSNGGSQRNLNDKYSMEDLSNFSKSEKNIRPISEQNIFQKKKINFQTVEISDNFETPKSKYRTVKESLPREQQKIHEPKSGIRFYPLGDNRRSKMSSNSRQSSQYSQKLTPKQPIHIEKVQKGEKTDTVKVSQRQKQKISSESSSSQSLKSASNIKNKQNDLGKKDFDSSQENISKDKSSGNVYAAELSQQLKLNYDYYVYNPTVSTWDNNGNSNVNNDQKGEGFVQNGFIKKGYQGEYEGKQSSVQQNGQIDITF